MMIIGHRGASAYDAENTLSSFKEAVKMKVGGIECDIRFSKDKKLAVVHDETINRTTSGKGKVKSYSMKELKEYGIPELKEVLKLAKKAKMLIFIEIKERGTEKKIVDAVKKEKMEEKAIIVSFFKDSLAKVRKLSKIRVGLGFIFAKWDVRPFKTAQKIDASWLIPHYRLLTAGFVKSAHEKNLKVLAWIVNDLKLGKKLSKMGVDGIATNKPDIFSKI